MCQYKISGTITPHFPETRSMCQQNISLIIALHFPEIRSMFQQSVSGTIALHLPEKLTYIFPRQGPCVNKISVVPLPYTPRDEVHVSTKYQWYHYPTLPWDEVHVSTTYQWYHYPTLPQRQGPCVNKIRVTITVHLPEPVTFKFLNVLVLNIAEKLLAGR